MAGSGNAGRVTATVTVAERPDLAPVVADWLRGAFWQHRGATLFDIERLVRASDAVLGPPQCFVRLVDGEPVGTASLIHSDLDARPDLAPWLAGLYVAPASRRLGHGAAIVRTVEAAAARAGIPRLWLYTHTAERLYAGFGWQRAETFARQGTVSCLMYRDLFRPP